MKFQMASMLKKGDTTYGISDAAFIALVEASNQKPLPINTPGYKTAVEEVLSVLINRVFNDPKSLPYPKDKSVFFNNFTVGNITLGITVMYVDDNESGQRRFAVISTVGEQNRKTEVKDGQHRLGFA